MTNEHADFKITTAPLAVTFVCLTVGKVQAVQPASDSSRSVKCPACKRTAHYGRNIRSAYVRARRTAAGKQ